MVQCKATTKTGERCNAHAVKGSEYCWFHGGGASNSRNTNLSQIIDMSKGAVKRTTSTSFSYRKIFGTPLGETPRKEKLKLFNDFYDKGGIVSQGIDSYVNTAVHNGYQLIDGETGEPDSDLTKIIEELDDRINIHDCSIKTFLNFLISGFCWGEMEIKNKKIQKLIFYPTDEIDIIRDKNSDIKKISQIRGGEEIAKWSGNSLENTFFFNGKLKDSEPFGKGIMERIYELAKEHKEMGKDLAAVVKFTAYPFRVVKVGSDNYPASEAAVEKVANEVDDLEPGDWLATRHNLEFEFHNPEHPEALSEAFISKTKELIVALGVPSLYTAIEDIDAGTLKEIRAIFNSTVRTLQITMARQFEAQIINKQLDLLGKLKKRTDIQPVILSWNPLTVSVLSILELTQLVAAGIISPSEARRILESMGYGLLRGKKYIEEIKKHREILNPIIQAPKETHPSDDDPDKSPNERRQPQKDGETPPTKEPSQEPTIKPPQPNAPVLTASEWLEAIKILQNKNPFDADTLLQNALKKGIINEK